MRHSMETCNILLIEDNEADRAFSSAFLRTLPSYHTLAHCDSLRCAQLQLNLVHFDLVITDLGLPDSQGLNTVKKLLPFLRNTPLIVLTGERDRHLGLDAIKLGAQDYLEKGRYDMELFHRSVLFSIQRDKVKKVNRL